MTTITEAADARPPSSVVFFLFYAVLTLSALYQLQHYAKIPFSASSRAVLFGTIVCIILWRCPRRAISLHPLFWALGLSVALTALHTWWSYGATLAVAATTRFANVMALAPLMAILAISSRNLRPVYYAFIAILLVTTASLLYQYFGGTLPALVGNYIAIRADLIRHMTAVGEPNVGGMLGVIVFVIGATIPRLRIAAIAISALSIAVVILSLSKAATIGLALAVAVLLTLTPKAERLKIARQIILSFGCAVLFLVAIGAADYISVSVRSVFGGVRGEPSALADFANRQSWFSDITSAGSAPAVILRILFGASFGIAGSAAQGALGNTSSFILPHNSYLEMLLTGGVFMVGTVILLVARAMRNIRTSMLVGGNREDLCALICLVVLSCWMLIYPTIYEPATGALLWSLVGYGNCIALTHGRAQQPLLEGRSPPAISATKLGQGTP